MAPLPNQPCPAPTAGEPVCVGKKRPRAPPEKGEIVAAAAMLMQNTGVRAEEVEQSPRGGGSGGGGGSGNGSNQRGDGNGGGPATGEYAPRTISPYNMSKVCGLLALLI